MKDITSSIYSFENLIEGNFLYVDKTEYIWQLIRPSSAGYFLSRPRRFGKSLTVSTLKAVFEGKKELFKGLAIYDKPYDWKPYPVIHLSFGDYNPINNTIELLNAYLLDKVCTIAAELSVDLPATEDASAAFRKLIDKLSDKDQVVILVDEYDKPILDNITKPCIADIQKCLKGFYSVLKDRNEKERFLFVTGVSKFSHVSLFSDLNNLKVVTTTSDEYATSFGFTEEEVFAALDECGLGEEREGVKAWYDGFVFGKHSDIYNPWSVLNFLDTNGQYDTYWANTSGNRLIGRLIQEGNKNIKVSFERLLKMDRITSPIDEQIVYNRLGDNEVTVWSLLLASGYLKVIEKEKLTTPGMRPKYTLSITNGEVLDMFYNMVHDWFMETEVHYNDFVSAMLYGNVEEMNVCINKISKNVFSYFDTGKDPSDSEPERFYHGLVLGLLTELNQEYILTSNRESGLGRYDVMIEPRDKSKAAYILEFKVHNPKRESSLEETVKNALKQIEEKQYETELIAKGYKEEQIRKYGFAFAGKEVLIGEE